MRLNDISISVLGEKSKFKIAFFRFFCEHPFIRTKVCKARQPNYLMPHGSCARALNTAKVAVWRKATSRKGKTAKICLVIVFLLEETPTR
jgi:hypothetical protein